MIAYIRGKVQNISPTQVIIEANGIGYEIHISLNTYTAIQNKKECALHTYFSVKEDAQTLFGFWEPNEKEIFKHLISVSGVGPSSARMIVSALSPNEVRDAIISGNASLLQSVKGIGPKSAQRLVLELKDKVGKSSGIAGPVNGAASTREEALAALTMLGFSRGAAEKAMVKVMQGGESDLTVETLIKESLKNL